MLGPSKRELLQRIEALEKRLDGAEGRLGETETRVTGFYGLADAFRGAIRNLSSGFLDHRGWIEDMQESFTVHPKLRSKLAHMRHLRRMRDEAKKEQPKEQPAEVTAEEGDGERTVHEAAS